MRQRSRKRAAPNFLLALANRPRNAASDSDAIQLNSTETHRQRCISIYLRNWQKITRTGFVFVSFFTDAPGMLRIQLILQQPIIIIAPFA